MSRPASGRPTDFELKVLKILWERGPSTVRSVHAKLANDGRIGITTALKMMQVMRDKGLLKCDTQQRPQLFRATRNRQTVLKSLAGDLLQRAFDGSTRTFLLHALSAKQCSPTELAEIRELIDQHERNQK
jgi:predicted transcriptional regulator